MNKLQNFYTIESEVGKAFQWYNYYFLKKFSFQENRTFHPFNRALILNGQLAHRIQRKKMYMLPTSDRNLYFVRGKYEKFTMVRALNS